MDHITSVLLPIHFKIMETDEWEKSQGIVLSARKLGGAPACLTQLVAFRANLKLHLTAETREELVRQLPDLIKLEIAAVLGERVRNVIIVDDTFKNNLIAMVEI